MSNSNPNSRFGLGRGPNNYGSSGMNQPNNSPSNAKHYKIESHYKRSSPPKSYPQNPIMPGQVPMNADPNPIGERKK